jgi:glycosyltransferase involved in cell wall biosynthesis
MTDRPRIAFFSQVAPFPPPLFGAQIRVDRLIRELLVEFDVAFVCQTSADEQTLTKGWSLAPKLLRVVTVPRPPLDPSREPQWGSPLSSGRAALRSIIPGSRPALHDHLRSPELVSKARALFEEERIEAVWASRTWMAEMALAAGARRIIVDIDDFDGRTIMGRLSRSPFYRRKPLHVMQAAHLQRYERFVSHRFDAVCTCKNEDLDLLEPGGRARRHVVPNGVDVPLSASDDCRVPFSMLFVGALWYEPNAEALRFFIGDVLPALRQQMPQAKLIVAGRGPIAPELTDYLSCPGVEVHESPDDLSQFYARASLCVAPLLTGGGTSIKVLEGLAHRVPVIATPVAVRGLGLSPGTHLAIGSSASEFIEGCADILTNPDKAQALASAGRLEVSRRFTWQAVGDTAREAVRALLVENGAQ